MVDERRVERLLQGVRGRLRELRAAAELAPTSLRSDALRFAGVKYLFATALEGCLDVAQHLCASEGLGVPKTNADAMRVMAMHGVLESEQGARMAQAVGFRNILVHQYLDVDDDIVLAHLDELDELDAFVSSVVSWMEAQASD